MLEWVLKNKEWLFSGAGLSIVTLLVFLFRNRRPGSPPLQERAIATPTTVLSNNDALWTELAVSTIRTATPKNAWFLEYSSASVRHVIDIALEHNWHVTLLVRDPESLKIQWQKQKIDNTLTFLLRDQADGIAKGRLTVIKYNAPGSIRIRLFEDAFVTLGWYTYDRRSGYGDKQIFGHNNPTLTVLPNDPYWHALTDFAKRILTGMHSPPSDPRRQEEA